MTKLYVPHLGDDLRLTADWTFRLHNESRNGSLIDLYNMMPQFDAYETDDQYYSALDAVLDYGDKDEDGYRRTYGVPFKKLVTIPIGTILRIKRIFIRQGMPDYDSITFATKLPGERGKLKPVRFWAKLDDCNTIEFEKVANEEK